jgi:hypothetical protein
MVLETQKPVVKPHPVLIATNHNKKLNCDYFVILQVARQNGIPESVAEKTIFRIQTKDNSHPPVEAKVIDSIRQPLKDISGTLTRLSHGLGREEFISKMLEQSNVNTETEMVAYVYQKVIT